MDFTIDAGTLNAWSQDMRVGLIIYPRRAEAGDPTLVRLRCAPRPAVDILPEDEGQPRPVGDWVWSGTAKDAARICELVRAQLHHWLRRDDNLTASGNAWRRQVRHSLGLVPEAAESGDALPEAARG